MYEKSEDRGDYQQTSRPIGVMARDLPDGFVIAEHEHPRGQLIYGTSGAIVVSTPYGTWVSPPHRGVWIPPGVPHSMRTAGDVPMRTVYVDSGTARDLPARCVVIKISPLLRELLVEGAHIPIEYELGGRDDRLMQLIVCEIEPCETVPLDLPFPNDPVLRETVCRRLVEDPACDLGVHEWAQLTHMSYRTFARRFHGEVGMSFGQWRQQLRLLTAVEMLAQGMSPTTVSGRLGYASPSAFTAMFRRALGAPPTDYLG